MNTLIQRIQMLSTNDAIEAARFFSDSIKAKPENLSELELKTLYPANAYAHLKLLEDISRIILINAAAIPEYESTVEKSIDSAGRKNFILGDAEMISLSVILLGALKIILNPVTEESFEYTDKEGKRVKHVKKHSSDISSLTKIFDKIWDKKK